MALLASALWDLGKTSIQQMSTAQPMSLGLLKSTALHDLYMFRHHQLHMLVVPLKAM